MISEQSRGDDWRTFDTQSILGGILLAKRDFVEAEQMLLSGYEGMNEREERIPAPEKIRLTEAVERLIKLYQSLDQSAPNKGYDTEIRRWQQKLDDLARSGRKSRP